MDSRVLGLGRQCLCLECRLLGSTIGFYGGVNYGFGYGGVGYEGGYWQNGAFSYNTSVNNIDVSTFHNTYEKTVSNERAGNMLATTAGPVEQPLDRPLRKKLRHMSVILRQRPHKQGINRPPARTTNYWRP
jgi:hypothetical protein